MHKLMGTAIHLICTLPKKNCPCCILKNCPCCILIRIHTLIPKVFNVVVGPEWKMRLGSLGAMNNRGKGYFCCSPLVTEIVRLMCVCDVQFGPTWHFNMFMDVSILSIKCASSWCKLLKFKPPSHLLVLGVNLEALWWAKIVYGRPDTRGVAFPRITSYKFS